MSYDKQYWKQYYKEHKERILQYNKQYRKEHRKERNQWNKQYYDEHEKEILQYRNAHKAKNKKYHKEYSKTEKGKVAQAKIHAKRKRNLQWIKMFDNPFDDDIAIDWHHIDNVYVVAIPRDLHQLYNGKTHREMTMDIVKQFYLE